jgi:hypothetical protein
MGVPRMIQGQFGAINYDTGVVPAGEFLPTSPSVAYNENLVSYQGVKRHNDVFYFQQPGNPLNATNPTHFMTYQYVDLRDLLEEKAGMDDVVINIQRQGELPFPNQSYNVAPGVIEETFLVLLGDYDLDKNVPVGGFGGFNIGGASRAGFIPMLDPSGEDSQGGLPFEVLYREVRQYTQDPSQNFTSPDMMGSFAGTGAGADPTQASTRFVGSFRLSSRTIGGYPDLLVGPGLTIIRAFSVYPSSRLSQTLKGGNAADTAADEFTYLEMRLQCQFPALQYNIVGTQRPLTATETATYYSNILMKS